MRSMDGNAASNISTTTAAFRLDGGIYALSVVATFGGGSVDLQVLGPDGSTYVSALTAAFLANGTKVVFLPPGAYKWVIATATAVYVSANRVPGE